MTDEVQIKLVLDSDAAERDLDAIERRRRREDRDDQRDKERERREDEARKASDSRDAGAPTPRFGIRPGQVASLAIAGPSAAVAAIPVIGPPISQLANNLAPFIAENPEFLGIIQGIVDQTIEDTLPETLQDRAKQEVGQAFGAVAEGTAFLRSIPQTVEATKGLARSIALQQGGQGLTAAQQQVLLQSVGKFQKISEFNEQMRIFFEANSNKIVARGVSKTVSRAMKVGR